jgi:outer membrane protein assembly factor BamD (BamD/ComL family)
MSMTRNTIAGVLRPVRKLLLTALLALVAACAGNDELDDEIGNLNEAYETAQTSIARGNFRRGIQIFEAMQARYRSAT